MSSTVPVTLVYSEIGYLGGIERVMAEILKYLAANGRTVNAVCSSIDPALEPLCSRIFYLPPETSNGRIERIRARLSWMRSCTDLIRQHRQELGIIFAAPGCTWEADVVMAGSCHLAAMLERSKEGYHRWVANPLNWLLILSEVLPYHRSVKRIMVPSMRTKTEITGLYRVDNDRINVVPHGVDSTRFFPAPLHKTQWRRHFGLPEDGFIVLTVTNEIERKGCFEIVDAVRILSAESADVHYVVAGRDNYIYLKNSAQQLGVAGRLTLLGPQSGPELSGLYQASDVFVLPTRYESFALVCMEAMACGIPLVATRVGGIEDYLRDGENGLFVERSALDIANALRRLLVEEDFFGRLSAGAQATALSYAWNNLLKDLNPMLVCNE
jgi:UDP-glucose:(heptosyl)LPS alpha-1,3-glucosyltransferase